MIDTFRAALTATPTLEATFREGDSELNAQVIATFPNGYGASIVRGPYTYGGNEGLFELAVLDRHGHLTYDTPITSDVEGWLTVEDVFNLLLRIQALPS